MSTNYEIGTIGIATTDLIAMAGTIPKGARVQIVAVGSRGYDLLDLDTGMKLTETGYNSITPVRSSENRFEIGTIGIATTDLITMAGTIPKGARVQIVAVGSRGYDLLDLDTGMKLTETGYNSIIPTIHQDDNDMNKCGSRH